MARGRLRMVLGDQLSRSLSCLADLDPATDVVVIAEVMAECTYVRHHKQKIALVLAAMRHFAAELRAAGVRVDYVTLDDPANSQSLRGEMLRAVARHDPAELVTTEPGEWRLLEDMRGWEAAAGRPCDIRADDRFLCSIAQFRSWARGRSTLRMEFFYRDMRRRQRLLMEGDAPAGGRWNFDAENRRRLPRDVEPPPPPAFAPDAATRDVLDLVAARFAEHFGSIEGFAWPVTRAEAEAALAEFVAHRLPRFGDWQDAMRQGAPVLFHAAISTSLNLGLLDPLAVCRAAEAAWRDGRVALNAAEGFVRQILGWREFMRGVYWLRMPEFGRMNALAAGRALPWFYWSAETRMNCVAQVVGETRANAWAHHIQRLMVTGNFALLAGIDPDAVDEWYLIVYADAYQWVEMPNTRGMALFADGGVVGSKPYAASGAYIDRMSDYCGRCHYDVRDATGARGCPFNALYWDFIARHAGRFAANPRMAMPLRNWARMAPERQAALRARAADLLAALDRGEAI